MKNYPLEPIAVIRSPFREKFATPRQPGLTPSVKAVIELYPASCPPEAVRGLDGFSHIWLIFVFHQDWRKGWKPTVRPPRLGGNKRVGVYASRSPFRPNYIGLSAVRLSAVHCINGKVSLEIEGADLIDGTPILDIKPYIPYGDSLPNARSGYAGTAPRTDLHVIFSNVARKQLLLYQDGTPELETMIQETLSLDPRPAYRRNTTDLQEYGILLDQYNIRWKVQGKQMIVLEILPQDTYL